MTRRLPTVLFSSVGLATMTAGASPTALLVSDLTRGIRQHLERPFTLGADLAKLKEELCRVADECGAPNWDGSDALPVTRETYQAAYRVIEVLPLDFGLPSVGVEPDGHLTLEWYREPRRTLSISVSPERDLHYAALLGNGKVAGTEAFLGEFPQAIIAQLRRLYAV
jgi:hypothetical protein